MKNRNFLNSLPGVLSLLALSFFAKPAMSQFTCATATTITDGQCLTNVAMGGSFSGGFAGCNGGSTPVRFFNFTAPGNGDCVQFNITNPTAGGTWEVMIYTSGCGAYVSGSGGCIENVVAGAPFSVSSQNSSGTSILTPGTNYTLILSSSAATNFDICFTSPSAQASSNECSGAINIGTQSNFYNGGDCQFSGSFDDGTTTDPAANLLCAGSLENTQWLSFTASGTGNITLTGSNISCTGGGCGFQFGIFSAGVGGNCCGALTHLGCYGDKVCAGGQSTAGPTNPAGRVTWSGTSASGFTATISGVSANEVFCFVMDGNADADCRYTLTATGILPLGITGLDGFIRGNEAVLTWMTQEEKGSSFFEIQRSTNGQDYLPYATVNAAGNSTSAQYYSYTDLQPAGGMNYYRVVQMNENGANFYSNTVNVMYEIPEIHASVSQQEILLIWGSDLESQETLRIRIMSVAGQLVSETILTPPGYGTTISTEGLKPGVYFIAIEGKQGNHIVKVLVP